MNPCVELAAKLKGHPVLKVFELPQGIRIDSPGPEGFAVHVYGEQDHWTVYLGDGGFHDEFSDPQEVLNFAAWCYSGEARLREIRRGKVVQKCVLEAHSDGEWRPESTTGFFFFPFWLPKREAVFQNPNLLAD